MTIRLAVSENQSSPTAEGFGLLSLKSLLGNIHCEQIRFSVLCQLQNNDAKYIQSYWLRRPEPLDVRNFFFSDTVWSILDRLKPFPDGVFHLKS